MYNYDFRIAFRISAAVILTAGTLCCWSFTPADSGAPAELIQGDDNDDNNDSDDKEKDNDNDNDDRDNNDADNDDNNDSDDSDDDDGDDRDEDNDDSGDNNDDNDDNGEWSSVDGESLGRCTSRDVMRRPQIALWYAGNCLSYLGFYMPFLNLASPFFHSLVTFTGRSRIHRTVE